MAQIFFDDEQLRRGDYVNVSEILSGSSAQYELGEWIARGGNDGMAALLKQKRYDVAAQLAGGAGDEKRAHGFILFNSLKSRLMYK